MIEFSPSTCQAGLSAEEQYLHAYGRAAEAARNGDREFVVDTEITKAVQTAGVHAYADAGLYGGGAVVREQTAAGDEEAYLSMYRQAYHAAISGERDIALPVRGLYENSNLRWAVIDACRDAGSETLEMRTAVEPSEGLSRRVGSYFLKALRVVKGSAENF